jgi:cyclic pyranopterin phosphate synthase
MTLSHLDKRGKARMVDIGDKDKTEREAVARGSVLMSKEAFQAAMDGDLKKGDLRTTAELAGVMAAKRTAELIPFCHPLSLTHIAVSLEFQNQSSSIQVEAQVRTKDRTGVEMEALTAVSVAALTVYDMIKALDKSARIQEIRLVSKRGGSSGELVLE